MHVDVRYPEAFLAVARHTGFKRAVKSLDVFQPAFTVREAESSDVPR